MKLIWKYMRPFAGRMSVGLLIKTVGTMMDLLLPMILEHLIDEVVPKENMREILFWGILMVIFAVIGLLGNVIANRMAALVARNCAREIRHDLFDKTLRLSARQVDEFTIPSLESRLTSDTYNVHHFVGMIQRLGVRAPILLVGGIVLTIGLDPGLSAVMLVTLPFITVVVWQVSKRSIPLYTEQQRATDRMVRVVREDSQGIRVIKALSKKDYERRRFDGVNRGLVAAEKKAALAVAVSNPLMSLFLNVGLTAVIVVGAFRISAGETKIGMIISFLSFFTLITNALLSVTRMFVMSSKSSASAARIAQVLNTPDDLEVLPFDPAEVEPDAPAIEFRDVGFSYSSNGAGESLGDISFTVERGKTLGVIGATGSGKSTLAMLLMRFYDVNSGAVLINGSDVRTYPADELHSMFGVVLQNDFIYAGTVEDNVTFGRKVDEERMKLAAAVAQADFIEAFDEGWQRMLTSKGTNVSGGQKQRLLITRAVAGNPEILILDDSSSALDYRTDAGLRKAINTKLRGTTKVIIAQRVSSVMNADMIIVLDHGRIIGSGTHDELIAGCPVYREISESQMGGDVLE